MCVSAQVRASSSVCVSVCFVVMCSGSEPIAGSAKTRRDEDGDERVAGKTSLLALAGRVNRARRNGRQRRRRWWRGGGLKGTAASCVVGESTEECDGGGAWVGGRRNATWVEEV